MKTLKFLVALVTILLPTILFSQASVLSSNITAYNVSPESMLEANIMNSNGATQVVMEAKIMDAQNNILIRATSMPFNLPHGQSSTGQLSVTVATVSYGSSNATEFVKISHTLPSGSWSYCVSISGVDIADELCNSIDAEYSSFLYLVNPPDGEEIETQYPVLTWIHSDPFSQLGANESFRIIVTEFNQGQSAESAVNTNTPVYLKDYLTSHMVQYPFDATELQVAHQYAWQVQKLANGVIIDKTEAWKFKLKDTLPPPAKNFTILKPALDGSTYYAAQEIIYFKFEEPYYSDSAILKATIFDKTRTEFVPQAKNEIQVSNTAIIKYVGVNLFEIDLKPISIPPGIYTLEVTDEKRKAFLLQFMIK